MELQTYSEEITTVAVMRVIRRPSQFVNIVAIVRQDKEGMS